MMSDTLIRRSELDFLLWDWLKLERVLGTTRFADIDRETVDAVLDLSEKLAEQSFLSHYKRADEHEPSLDVDGNVHILPEISEALRQYAELGLFGASIPERHGGLNLPTAAASASQALFMAANVATAAYPMLTVANARLILAFGNEAQIEHFATPQIAGVSLGTMCLSEPQAGSGLGDIRTRAEPDGPTEFGECYRLTGNKMWISGGDHDATTNIVHLVLAKIPDADGRLPAGTKGISLFIVPKVLPRDLGRNDVAVAGLNHKMGYRGTANCLLNFGEGRFMPDGRPGAIGYLVGNAGQGLAMMFQMMNEARIGVGLGAAALAYRGYRLAVRYAGERVQGRALDAPKGDSTAVPILRHPDVRHMLLAQKCYAEGALALVLYCARAMDEGEDAEPLLALLTPIAKTWASEWGLQANQLAIQVHGGYGYTRDFDVEQLYRDNRLNPIHEGTTGIQALDLVGRKILHADGAALRLLGERIHATSAAAADDSELSREANALQAAWAMVHQSIDCLRQAPTAEALANATAFLNAFGHVVVAWIWLDQAVCCRNGAIALSEAESIGKIQACRYFFLTELPKVRLWAEFAGSLSRVAVDIPDDAF